MLADVQNVAIVQQGENSVVGSIIVNDVVINIPDGIRSLLLEKVRSNFVTQKNLVPNSSLLPHALESGSCARFITKDNPELGRHPTDVVENNQELIVKFFDPASPGDARRQAFESLRKQIIGEGQKSARDPYEHARQLHSIGELVEASFFYDKAAQIEAEKDVPRPNVMLDSALVHAKLFKFETARRDLQTAISILQETGIQNSFLYLEALSNLASVLAWSGYGQEAVGWCQRAILLAEQKGNGVEINAPRLRILFANILFSEGNVNESDRELCSVERDFPPTLCHSLLHAQAQNDLSLLRTKITLERSKQRWRKNTDLSEPFERQQAALNFRQIKCALGDPALIESFTNMAALLKEGQEYDEALSCSSEALSLAGSHTFNPNHFIFIYLNNNKAAILERMGEIEEATILLTEAHSLASKYFSDNHPIAVDIVRNLNRLSS